MFFIYSEAEDKQSCIEINADILESAKQKLHEIMHDDYDIIEVQQSD